jgi:hypothetical protein
MARYLMWNQVAVAELTETNSTLDLQLGPAAHLTGTVTDQDGRPIGGAMIQLGTTLRLGPNQLQTTQALREPVIADTRGAYEITALPEGLEYGLHATAADHAMADLSVAPGQATRKGLELSPIKLKRVDQWITGTVVDTNGNPVREVTIQVRDQGLPDMNAYTDANGYFKLRVCEGPLTVFAIYNPITRTGSGTQARLSAKGGDTSLVLKLEPLKLPAALRPR